MKKLFFVTCISILFFGCKREQVLTTLEDGEILNYERHCYNGIKDGDETDIDCGGECAACPELPHPIPTCTHPANTLIVLGSSYTATVGTITTGSPYEVNGTYSSSNTAYTMKLKNEPNLTTNYLIGPYNPTADNEVQIIVYYGFTPLTLSSGKVFFSKNGNVFTAVICDGIATTSFASIDIAGSISF